MSAAILGALLIWAALSTGAAALWSAARTLMKRATPAPDYGPSDYEWDDRGSDLDWLDDLPADVLSSNELLTRLAPYEQEVWA